MFAQPNNRQLQLIGVLDNLLLSLNKKLEEKIDTKQTDEIRLKINYIESLKPLAMNARDQFHFYERAGILLNSESISPDEKKKKRDILVEIQDKMKRPEIKINFPPPSGPGGGP